MRRAGSLGPRLVPSDIQPVHDCVPDEAGVSVTSIVVVVTPWIFLPVCQPWRRCLYLIHESVKLPGLNVDVCVQNIDNLAAFKGKTAQFLSHCHYGEVGWVGAD